MLHHGFQSSGQAAIGGVSMDDLFESPSLSPAGPEISLLRGSRVQLRALREEDAPVFHRLINDWQICRLLPEAPFPYPAATARDWIASAVSDEAARRAFQFAIISRHSGKMIGSVGLRLTRDKTAASLGYWLGKAFWGQGFAAEAASLVIAWGFAELPILSITATVAEGNDASVRILQRLGFQPAGNGHESFICRAGAHLPVQYLSIVREQLSHGDIQVTEKAAGDSPGKPTLLVVAAALIDPEGKILLARRPAGKRLAGLWEFPGGKLEPGEAPEAGLIRELREEIGIEVAIEDVAPFAFASHAYDKFHLLMPLFVCRRWAGTPSPREGQALAWVAPDRLVEYPMPPADRPLIPMLRDFL